MARETQGLVAPRLPASLGPGADAVLEDDAEWSGWVISGDFSARVATRVDVGECRVSGAALTGVELGHARMSDVVFEDCELSGATFHETALTRVEFRECRMLGFSAPQARLRDVRFTNCRMDGAEFRMAAGDRVEYERCSLVGADFYAASLSRLHVFDCDLTRVEFSQVELVDARLHGSRLEGLRGARYLRGVTIDSDQVVPMALEMFTATGILVDDER